jgi:ankyrin repeat protein
LYEGHQKIVELLLERGADVNAQPGFYGTAVEAALEGCNYEIVEVLLEWSAHDKLSKMSENGWKRYVFERCS